MTNAMRKLRSYAATLNWSEGRTKHDQCHKLFLRAKTLGTPEGDALALARELVLQSGGTLSTRDIQRQAVRAFDFAQGPDAHVSNSRHVTPFRPKPKPAPEAVSVDLLPPFTLEQLKESSPGKLPGSGVTRHLLQSLFEADELLCLGRRRERAEIATLSGWLEHPGLAEFQFVVPSPMLGRSALTQEGTLSPRALANVGRRVNLVIEFDQGSLDDQARKLRFLDVALRRLVLVVFSGNKSLHGWFRVGDLAEEDCRELFEAALALGADKATWAKNQWVRLPGGQRDNGERQEVIYFAPRLQEGGSHE